MYSNDLIKMMKIKNLSIKQLASKANVPEDTIKNIVYNRVSDIKLSTVIKMANAMNCSIDELIGRNCFSDEESKLIKLLRSLSTSSKNFILSMAELEQAITVENEDEELVTLFQPTGNMEDGMIYDSSNFMKINVSGYIQKYGRDKINCALFINSDSFNPTYNHGDILLICNKILHHGDTGIFIRQDTGQLFIRKYIESSPIRLEPITNYGTTISIDKNSIEDMNRWIKFGYVVTKYRSDFL